MDEEKGLTDGLISVRGKLLHKNLHIQRAS
jgi:hypothetical protein